MLAFYQIILGILSVSVFVIGFFAIKQSNVVIANETHHKNKNQTPQKIVKSKDNEEYGKDIQKLKAYMENEKPYLEFQLSLAQLAQNLDWNSSHLSKILNKQLHKNFYEFVNHYRVEEVKNLLKSNSKYSNLGIAFESGFNSKSSFHRIFKEFTGMTPSDYKKSI